MGCQPEQEGCTEKWFKKLEEIQLDSTYVVLLNHSSTLINADRSSLLNLLKLDKRKLSVYDHPDKGPLVVAEIAALKKLLKNHLKTPLMKLMRDQSVITDYIVDQAQDKFVGQFNEDYRIIRKGRIFNLRLRNSI